MEHCAGPGIGSAENRDNTVQRKRLWVWLCHGNEAGAVKQQNRTAVLQLLSAKRESTNTRLTHAEPYRQDMALSWRSHSSNTARTAAGIPINVCQTTSGQRRLHSAQTAAVLGIHHSSKRGYNLHQVFWQSMSQNGNMHKPTSRAVNSETVFMFSACIDRAIKLDQL